MVNGDACATQDRIEKWRAEKRKMARRKKGAAVAGGSKVNREASNRVDRSHSMSRNWTRIVMKEKA
jgi:transposase